MQLGERVREFESSLRQARPATSWASPRRATIWIDMDNSPHVPFFAPISAELEKRGYSVVLTARDCFQVRELADFFHLKYKLIGHHSGKNRFRKLAGLCFRAVQLVPILLKERPRLAVSICSRSQLIVSALSGIPSVFMGDYEHAKGWAVIRPTWLVCPEVMPAENLGVDSNRILKYRGIKEDVYVPQFYPDSTIRREVGLGEEDVVATVRPPACEAHYHTPETDKLFDAAIQFLGQSPQVKIVALPRTEKQAAELRARWPELFSSGAMRIPSHVVDGLNLIWNSDLVISAGGTMNREAAALGVPVYSVFRGPTASVDRYLAQQGRLVIVEGAEEIPKKITLRQRSRAKSQTNNSNAVLKTVVDQIIAIAEREDASRATRPICSVGQAAAGHGNREAELGGRGIIR